MSGFWARLRAIFTGPDKTDPRPTNARTGAAGEAAAAGHLEAAGLKVLARNWRNPDDSREEIDLVCRDGEVLVFVEVKTRKSGARVGGYLAVDKRKKAVLLRACRAYLGRLRPSARHYRFDIVEVSHAIAPAAAARAAAEGLPPTLRSMQDGGMEVLHFSNVPLFPERTMHRHG
jgi:putative endonuclease